MANIELNNIPQVLKDYDQWALWRYETGKDGKENKIPYQTNGNGKASSTDASTWTTYDDVIRAGGFDGIFFVLSSNDPFTVVDFDDCINAYGEIDEQVIKWCKELNSYTEVSPSEEGLHVWVEAQPPGDRNRRAGVDIEFYSTARFMSVTGWHQASTPTTIEPRSTELKSLYDEVFAPNGVETNNTKQTPITVEYEPGLSLSDDEIIDKCKKAANGMKFRMLFDHGDVSDYGGDESGADMALMNMIAFFCDNDADQMERIFGLSALGSRPKWQRADYRQRTIQKAINRPRIEAADERTAELSNHQTKDAQERDAEAYAKALGLHRDGDPVNFILDTFETIHVGDRAPATGVLCGFACQSIGNTKGLQPSAYGESGYGKSHLAETMCWLSTQKYVLAATLSDKSLFNMRNMLLAGTTIFSDDVTLSAELADVLKRSTSRYQKSTLRLVSVNQGGKWQSVEQWLPPRLMWLLTSVDQSGGIQVANRQFAFSVDESEAHQRKVIAFEMWKANNGIPDFPLTDDVKVCRELLRIIKENDDGTERLFMVKTPYLPDSIDWNDIKNTRNLGMFLDLIKSFAMLRFMQREVDEGGFLIANADDLNDAINLYLVYAQDQMHHVTKSERKFLEKVMEAGEFGMNTDEMIDALNVTQQRVWKLGNNLSEKVPGFKVTKQTISDADIDGTRKSKTSNVYSINKISFALGDYESVLSRKKQVTTK